MDCCFKISNCELPLSGSTQVDYQIPSIAQALCFNFFLKITVLRFSIILETGKDKDGLELMTLVWFYYRHCRTNVKKCFSKEPNFNTPLTVKSTTLICSNLVIYVTYLISLV